IQLRAEISNLQDLHQLLGEINWVRPILGITNDELASLFNLLRGDCNIKSPRTHTRNSESPCEN
ncbi:POK18 protein, partial [Spelaeornis formosus]|nr:POK18 protein [Elachura formosa]